MEFIRTMFGFPNYQKDQSQKFFDVDDDHASEHNGRNFNVFTDPMEMHRYFEQQMHEVFKSFGFPNFRNLFEQFEVPAIEDDIHQDHYLEDPKNLREHFLKRGYEKPHYDHPREKVDQDLDGKLNLGDLDSMFALPSKENSVNIYQEPKPFTSTFFNQSVQVKTIRKSDGSIETHRTVHDNQGNEETKISHQLGDKQYTIIKKRDKDGKEEISENMVNMNENEKTLFQQPDTPIYGGTYYDSSMFSKLFK